LNVPGEWREQQIRVHFGGPVEPGRGFVLHSSDYTVEGTRRVGDGMALTGTTEILRDMALGHGPRQSLLALGYAGWGPGQLEAELDESSWLVESSAGPELFPEPEDDLWGGVLRDKGGAYRVVALMPEDPSVN
jgi:putative transcriptional regulator